MRTSLRRFGIPNYNISNLHLGDIIYSSIYTFLQCFSLSLLSLLALLSSCALSGHPHLDEAGRLMNTNPDSSLNILNYIKRSDLTNNADRAKYGLLLTQAMDKCQLNPTDSALISFSSDYFAKHGEDICKIMSNYYSGRVYNNIGNKALAITAFFKARQLAEKNGEYFWAGMANRGISDIYCDTYNNAEELHFAKEEYIQFSQSGQQPYLNYALLDLARAHHNANDIKESSRLCLEVLDSAKKCQDLNLLVLVSQLNYRNFIQEHNYREALKVLHQLLKSGYSDSNDSISLCEVLYETDRIREAGMLLDSISGGDEAVKMKLRYKLAKQSREFDKALNLLEKLDNATNSSFESSVSHNLTSTLAEYFELTKQLDDMKIHHAKISLFAVVAISISLLISIVFISVYLFKRKMRLISDKVVLAESIKESIEEAHKRKEADDSVIRMLLSEQYKMLDDLCYIVMTSNDSKQPAGRLRML